MGVGVDGVTSWEGSGFFFIYIADKFLILPDASLPVYSWVEDVVAVGESSMNDDGIAMDFSGFFTLAVFCQFWCVFASVFWTATT